MGCVNAEGWPVTFWRVLSQHRYRGLQQSEMANSKIAVFKYICKKVWDSPWNILSPAYIQCITHKINVSYDKKYEKLDPNISVIPL